MTQYARQEQRITDAAQGPEIIPVGVYRMGDIPLMAG